MSKAKKLRSACATPLDADERVALASVAVDALLRVRFRGDSQAALIVLDDLAERYGRAAKRDADMRRRIAAMMRTSPWIESAHDYKRVIRIVDRVAVIDERELLPEEDEFLERLSQLVVAYDSGLMSRI